MKLHMRIDGTGSATGPGDSSWNLLNRIGLPVPYDALYYEDGQGVYWLDGKEFPLDTQTISAIETYLMSNPTQGASVVHGVDAEGNYLGLVPRAQAHAVVPRGPKGNPAKHRWINGSWVAMQSLAETKERLMQELDQVAGSVRTRFLTSAPGQEGTYIVKEQQAKAFAQSNFNGPVPPYIQAEADAMGGTPQQATELILAIAHQWNNIAGPAIEKLRRQGKLAVEAATTTLDAQAAADTHRAQLIAITQQ